MRPQPELPVLSSAALQVLREDQPSDRELASAYERFARGTQRRAPGLLVSRWLIAGLVMGLGVAFGAEAAVQELQHLRAPPPAQRPVSEAAPRVRKAAPSNASLPSLAKSTVAPITPPHIPSPSSPNPKTSGSSAETTPTADSAIWAKAARGLRNNDFAETESALTTLERAGSPTDREAARLIRAQLMLHHGDASGARALLRDLADNAQSAQVRVKARSLLAQGSAKSNSALNVGPSGT
ncbi:MAG: hypothetical protein WDO69_24895 [Pseudomonadota bacterium]